MKRVLIMAGGTGGHVIPALTIAKQLQIEGIEVVWLGTRHGIEAKLVPEQNIPLHFVAIKGLRGKRWRSLITAPFKLTVACMQALTTVLKTKPNVVLGLGGFASGPGGFAAWLLRKPLIIHEQNAVPGLTNRILAHLAKETLEAFPHTFKKAIKAQCVGNPVRANIIKLQPPNIRFQVREQTRQLRVLILGGSLGAVTINEVIPHALTRLNDHKEISLWHQVGERHLAVTQAHYERHQVDVKLSTFIDNMASAYAWADLVICRAGAMTVTELAAAGVAAILIPYPYAVDDHQTRNAKYLAAKGAAIVVQQRQLTADSLARLLRSFLLDRGKLLMMANAAYQLRVNNATEQVVQRCLIAMAGK